ncbi:hypothetical protein, partial [Pseudomonas sp. PNPG3]|uniref:hypothetical protein n=1 Tax=Pseudomonas sp. PNPG3 TaxID=2919497 RepID=UPI001FFD256B
ISYDARYLRAIGISEGGFLGTAGETFGDIGVIDNGSGTISFVFNTLVGAVPGAFGSGALANIRFEAIGVGSSALSFGDVAFLDSGLGEIALDI